MATIMIVLDGLQDIPYKQLDDKTPYDFGKGENFKLFECACEKGKLVTTPDGFEPDTQTCVLTLLGVAPEQIPAGRSYIESLAIGMDMGERDIIMRSNFVKVGEDGTLEVPCCTPPEEIAQCLQAEIRTQAGYNVTRVGGYKSLLVIPDGGLYANSMKTNLPHQHTGDDFLSLLPSGNPLADSLADFSKRMLDKYAPYTVFNWGQSERVTLPSFESIHGISGAIVSKTHAVMGSAMAMGMACPNIETATGDTDTDLAAKVAATLELAATHDFVLLHVGGPDEATHRFDPVEKANFVAKMDTELIAPILNGVPTGTRIMLTCDHVALCSTGGHTDEPVEFTILQKGEDYGTVAGTNAVSMLINKKTVNK